MNFYNLKCFVTLVEELNFTKASAKLNITQPTLSKIIVAIEDEVGFPLFERTKKAVNLTNVGKQFYLDSQQILKTYQDSMALCSDLGRGIKGIVKVGFIAVPLKHIMRELTDACEIYCPEIKLQYVEDTQAALMRYLDEGKIDMALFCNWGFGSSVKYETHEIYRDEYCLFVSNKHPLAEREEVSISELANETFIICKSNNNLQDYAFYEKADNSIIINHLCRNAGFSPKIYATARTLLGMLMIVANNSGVSIAASHLKPICPGTRCIRIKDPCPTFSVLMAWSESTTNLAVHQIVETVKELSFQ